MLIRAEAIICGVRAHGEHGAIVRALTPDDGMVAGYVRGGRSRRLRPVLSVGNVVVAEFRARTDTQLPALVVELVASRAPLLEEPLAAAAIEWVTALLVATLPEQNPYGRIHDALQGILAAIEAAPSARAWVPALARYELLVLAELGFGLDLSHCAATGVTADLVWVSPKSGAAVSHEAGKAYADRLMRLPGFLVGGGVAEGNDALDALAITGRFLTRDLLTGKAAAILPARERLIERLTRAIGR